MMGIRRARAYSAVFCDDKGNLTQAARIVMGDLARFSGAEGTNLNPDAVIMAGREGRREVFSRIMNTLGFDFTSYYELKKEADNDRRTTDDY